MSNYQKFTLQTIREKLKNGEYESLVGVNRAIGKTKDLSPEDKEKAKALAAKHFGADAPAAKPAKKAKAAKASPGKRKKAAKKAEAKPAAASKKVAKKKATKKTGRRAPRAAEEAAPAASSTPAVVSEAKPKTNGAKPAAKAPSSPAHDDSFTAVIREMGSTIDAIDQALKSMETAKRLFPKAELEKGVELAVTAMGRAVSVLDASVISPLLPAEQKSSSGRGKRGKAAAVPPPVVEEPVEEQAEEAPEVEAEASTEEAPEDFDDANLTDEQRAQAEYARRTRPAILRRPGASMAGNSTT